MIKLGLQRERDKEREEPLTVYLNLRTENERAASNLDCDRQARQPGNVAVNRLLG